MPDASTTEAAPRKRRTMTIEEALRWAIRDELPKKREDRPIRGPQCAHDPIWRMGVFGSPIDCWNREPGMSPAMGDPQFDALVIEEALSEILQASAIGAALCPLDLLPYPIQAELRGKDDLDVLISTALHAPPRWLASCAIHGTRPDVGGGIEIEPVKSDNEKIKLWRTTVTPCGQGPDGKPWFTSCDVVATSKGDTRDTGLFCKLNYTRTGVEVVEEQLRYAMWHAALVHFVPALQFLISIEVVPPAAPIAPWLTPAPEPIAPLANVRSARRKRLEDRLRPGMRAGQRYAVAEHCPAAQRPIQRKAAPVRHIDPATGRERGELTA